MSGATRVVVATNAFGIGIDKADTRFVSHYQMPAGLDACYQESGRAGRDGASAECTLLFLHRDQGPRSASSSPAAIRPARTSPISSPISTAHCSAKAPTACLGRSTACTRRSGHCRWRVLLDHFGESEGFASCGTCDNCLRIAAARAGDERAPDGDDANADRSDAAPAPPLPSPGDPVKVPRYGRGVVAAVDAEGITVLFPEGSRRTFLPAFVQRVGSLPKRSEAAKVTASAA